MRALKAPRRTGEALVAPPQSSIATLLDHNVVARRADVTLLGRPLADIAATARTHLLSEALRYTCGYRDVQTPSSPQHFILAGHQPELFHPGVWFKNFLLDRIAREHNAVAINLVIDHDACRQASIRVPTGSAEQPLATRVSFDAAGPVVPWEARQIADRATYDSFVARSAKAIAPFVGRPLIQEFWPLAIAAADRGISLGGALSQARHAYEGQLGLQTLEIPLSQLCLGEAFAWFSAWLLTEASRVRSVYNAAVQAYRKTNHVRSASHPVPDLAKDGELCEVPLWVWTRDNPRRRHLFVARSSRGLTLTDREGWNVTVPGVACGSPLPLVERLMSLADEGVCLRPRALTTTWYARVVLSDLFIHGIGGAKYDEVTDHIIADLFGIEPPTFITATATLRLPIAGGGDPERELQLLRKHRRELRFHPEAVIVANGEAWQKAANEKRCVVAKLQKAAALPWNRRTAQALHAAITQANAAFTPWIEPQGRLLDDRETQLADQARAKQVLESREYAFCLFPRETLVPTLAHLALG